MEYIPIVEKPSRTAELAELSSSEFAGATPGVRCRGAGERNPTLGPARTLCPAVPVKQLQQAVPPAHVDSPRPALSSPGIISYICTGNSRCAIVPVMNRRSCAHVSVSVGHWCCQQALASCMLLARSRSQPRPGCGCGPWALLASCIPCRRPTLPCAHPPPRSLPSCRLLPAGPAQRGRRLRRIREQEWLWRWRASFRRPGPAAQLASPATDVAGATLRPAWVGCLPS